MSATRALLRAGRIAGFGALTAAMLPAYLARARMAPHPEQAVVRERWVRAWSTALLRLFGVTLVSHSIPRLEDSRAYLVVSNHRSTADILVLLRSFGGSVVSRADLAHWPLIGAAARSVGTVFVDRSSAISGANAVRTMRSLLDQRSTVIAFPEGTTFAGDEVRPFHAGAFVAALRARVDVIPVGVAYQTGSDAVFVNESFGAHLARMAAAKPSRVAMCVGQPITGAREAGAAVLRDRAHAEVQRLVHEARWLVDRG